MYPAATFCHTGFMTVRNAASSIGANWMPLARRSTRNLTPSGSRLNCVRKWARGASSAFSAAQALIDHVRSLVTPTPKGDCFSAAIVSDGSYGVPKGLVSSFPLHSKGDGAFQIVPNVPLDEFAKGKIAATIAELDRRREAEQLRSEAFDRLQEQLRQREVDLETLREHHGAPLGRPHLEALARQVDPDREHTRNPRRRRRRSVDASDQRECQYRAE